MTADMSYDEWKLASPPEEEDDGRGHEYGQPQPEPELTESSVRRWMVRELQLRPEEYESPWDPSCTKLAERAAAHFGVDDEGGPLDDPDHWIWDVAIDVGARP